MFLVGLTGGIATGKSTVASIIRALEIEIIDADFIARDVVQPGKRAWRKIREEFGEAVLNSDGTLNRRALGQIVFNDSEKRSRLNSITHPEIYKSIIWKVFYLFFKGHQFAVIDLPLLYESGSMLKYLHKTIVVVCEPDMQIERLMQRDTLTADEALARINAQMPLTEKAKLGDFLIVNNNTYEETKEQVKCAINVLKESRAHWKSRIVVFGSISITLISLGFGTYKLIEYLSN